MSIEIKFFASLRETLGKTTSTVEAETVSTLHDCWNTATENARYPANTLCAINMEYADINDTVKNGDEVAFFPPVSGG